MKKYLLITLLLLLTTLCGCKKTKNLDMSEPSVQKPVITKINIESPEIPTGKICGYRLHFQGINH